MRPNVKIDPASTLDDISAARIVRLMLKALALDAVKFDLAVLKALKASKSGLGNIVAQKRFFERISKAHGNHLIGSYLGAGSRKRFTMSFDEWNPVPALGQDLTQSPTWLAAHQITISCNGLNERADVSACELVCFTSHALVRLIQRAGVSTPEEYVDALCAFWPAIKAALHAARHNGSIRLPGKEEKNWLVPVSFNGRNLALPLVGTGSANPFAVVPTALAEHMFRPLPVFDEIIVATETAYRTTGDFKPLFELYAQTPGAIT
jgi:hypothetical protein